MICPARACKLAALPANFSLGARTTSARPGIGVTSVMVPLHHANGLRIFPAIGLLQLPGVPQVPPGKRKGTK